MTHGRAGMFRDSSDRNEEHSGRVHGALNEGQIGKYTVR
jgi:hypothetical protein